MHVEIIKEREFCRFIADNECCRIKCLLLATICECAITQGIYGLMHPQNLLVHNLYALLEYLLCAIHDHQCRKHNKRLDSY